MFNIQKNSKKAIDTLEGLTKSLIKRYESKNDVDSVSTNIAKLDMELKNKDNKLDENSNIDTIQNGIINDKKEESKDYLISPQKLYSIINQKSTTFFILDTRSSAVRFNLLSIFFSQILSLIQDYQNSQINLANSLNVPEGFLVPGTTAATVRKNLKVESRSQWDRRMNMVILSLIS